MRHINQKYFILLFISSLFLSQCGRQEQQQIQPQSAQLDVTHTYTIFSNSNIPSPAPTIPPSPIIAKENHKEISEEEITNELDFEVQNGTGKIIYVTCFSYIQKEPFQRWRWDKSPVYKLEPTQSVFINIDTIPDVRNRVYTFGYLGVFSTEQEAQNAILELTHDEKIIDLDLLYKLKGKKVVIDIVKYGFKEATLDFAIVEKSKKKEQTPELDFHVENQTGKPIYVTCFILQNKDNLRMTWGYDKSTVQYLQPGQVSIIDVDTIIDPRNVSNVTGDLAIFESNEEREAHDATYQLLEPKKRLSLGKLSRLKNKTVIIDVEKYGTIGDIVEFEVKPVRHLFEQQQKETVQTIINKKNAKKTERLQPLVPPLPPTQTDIKMQEVPAPLPVIAPNPPALVPAKPALENSIVTQKIEPAKTVKPIVPRKNKYELFAQS